MTEYEKAKFDEAQQAVLGCLLSGLGADGEAFRDAKAVMDAGGLALFDDEWACELWRRVEAAVKEGKDPSRYRHIKQVENLPMDFVERVVDNGVTGFLVEQIYLPELVEAARARAVKRALKEASESGDVVALEKLLKQPQMAPGHKTLGGMAARVITDWESAADHPGELSGIPSGLIDLDKKTWGWQPQNFIVIGARPSQGKTALLIGFARHAAIDLRLPTAFFSLESSGEEIVRRICCQMTGADQSRLRGGEALMEDIHKLPSAMSRLTKSPLHLKDCPGASIGWIQSEARKLKEMHGIKLVVVDYLQKVKSMQRNEKRTYEVAQVSEGLKELAVELNVPVIAAGQLNREPEKAKGRAPVLSDLADCGQIERDADIVALKHLVVPKDGPPKHQLILAKFRDGPTGIVNLAFVPHCARFDNLSPIAQEDVPNYDKD